MSSASGHEEYSGSYLDVGIHKAMLMDVVRTSAYEQAIREVVKADSRVIDFGTGTGVLAIFAARAGAARVDAIEESQMARSAREICLINGCSSVQVHHADHQSFRAEALADVLISEWMGHFVFHETMLEPLLWVRDRWLKPRGLMLPRRVSLHAALVTDEELHEDAAFLRRSPYAIDFGSIADVPLRQTQLVHLDESQVLLPAFDLAVLDMRRISETPRELSGEVRVEREVTTYGLVGWFSAELTSEVTLGTGPHDAPNHWSQIFFPFPEPLVVTPGRPLDVCIVPPRRVDPELSWAWRVSDGVNSVAVDERETVKRARGQL